MSVSKDGNIYTQPSISIKLSALHPRFELLQIERVKNELLPKVFDIVKMCAGSNIAVSFDAEEAFRLDIYLYVLTQLISSPELKGYNGIGFVVQAYQKRAFYVIDYIVKLAKSFNKKISVRLVKGAYWDAEIKNAQEQGLQDYPIYTVKEFTDVSYLACARKMLSNHNLIYSQFATHNTYSAAAIEEMAEGVEFEFQKLYGMGTVLHEEIRKGGRRSRIYSSWSI